MRDLNMNTNSAGKMFVCPELGCLFKTEYQSNMVRHKKTKHMHREQNGERYQQMSLCVKRSHEEEVEGSREDRPAYKLIKLHDSDAKRMEGITGVSCRTDNSGGVMSKDEDPVEKETAAMEMEGRGREKPKWTLGGVLCPNCQIKFRSASELANHTKFCTRRTSNMMRRKKKKHDSESSDEEFEYEDDEYAATCQGCDMSFASVAGLDAHRQRCNKKVRYGTNKLKGEDEVEGNNNFKQGVCEDGEPPFAEVNASLLSARSEVQVNKKLGVAGPNTVGEQIGGAGISQWDSNSKEEDAYSSLSQDVVTNTGELSERGTEDTSVLAGPLHDFSQSKSVSAKKAAKEASLENISEASPLLKKRAEVSGGGSWSDFIAENGASPSSETPPRRGRKTELGTPKGPEMPHNVVNKGGAETKVKMLVDFLSREGKPFRINLTLPRDCNMQRVLAKIADNFKTDIDQLSLSRKGIVLTGEERAENFEGEVVVVRPNMDQ